MKHDELDEKELEELESRLRRAVAGHKPEPPASLVDFIETVPARGATRRMGVAFGGLGLWHGLAVAAASAAVVVAVAGTAVLMSIGPDRGTAVASGTIGAPSAGLGTPTDYVTASHVTASHVTASEWPETSASPQASSESTASTYVPRWTPQPPPSESWESPSIIPTVWPTVTFSGTITNRSGAPLGGIYVSACNQQPPATCFDGNTGPDGRYLLHVIVGGRYVLMAGDATSTYATGFYSATSGFTYDLMQATVIDVGQTAVIQDFSLPLALHVTVIVTDSHAIPMAGVGAQLMHNASQDGKRTDASGSASFVVVPGTYWIWFQWTDGSGLHEGALTPTGVVDGTWASDALTFAVGSTDVVLHVTLP